MSGGGHPVGGELDIANTIYGTCSQIGYSLAYGHTPGSWGIDQGQWSALSQGHGLTGVANIIRNGNRQICHRHLPGTYHLVAGHLPGNGTVADTD